MITVSVVIDNRGRSTGGTTYYRKEVAWPTVPRVGDRVLLAGEDSGWGEKVRTVWFDASNGNVAVELDRCVDIHGEQLDALLLSSGWNTL